MRHGCGPSCIILNWSRKCWKRRYCEGNDLRHRKRLIVRQIENTKSMSSRQLVKHLQRTQGHQEFYFFLGVQFRDGYLVASDDNSKRRGKRCVPSRQKKNVCASHSSHNSQHMHRASCRLVTQNFVMDRHLNISCGLFHIHQISQSSVSTSFSLTWTMNIVPFARC